MIASVVLKRRKDTEEDKMVKSPIQIQTFWQYIADWRCSSEFQRSWAGKWAVGDRPDLFYNAPLPRAVTHLHRLLTTH